MPITSPKPFIFTAPISITSWTYPGGLPLQQVASQVCVASIAGSHRVNPNPPPVLETSDKAPESNIGIEPIPLKSEDKNNSIGSYFDWSATGIASSASIPPSLHTFAQDYLSRQPSLSLFRSQSFASLFDSSTAGNKTTGEVSTSSKEPLISDTTKLPITEASQDLECCDDCSSICSGASVQRFLGSIFDIDMVESKETPTSSQLPTSIKAIEDQEPSKITVADGIEIPYVEV